MARAHALPYGREWLALIERMLPGIACAEAEELAVRCTFGGVGKVMTGDGFPLFLPSGYRVPNRDRLEHELVRLLERKGIYDASVESLIDYPVASGHWKGYRVQLMLCPCNLTECQFQRAEGARLN